MTSARTLTDLGVRCYLRRPASEGPKPETQISPRSRSLNSVGSPVVVSSPLMSNATIRPIKMNPSFANQMKSKKTTDVNVLNCRYLRLRDTVYTSRWALRAAATGIVPVHDSCGFSEWGSEHTPRLEHNVRQMSCFVHAQPPRAHAQTPG